MSSFLPRWPRLSQPRAPSPAPTNETREEAGSPKPDRADPSSVVDHTAGAAGASTAALQDVPPVPRSEIDSIKGLLVLQLQASTEIDGKLDTTQDAVARLDTSMGRRIGKVEEDVKELKAEMRGFKEEFRQFRDHLIATLEGLKSAAAGPASTADRHTAVGNAQVVAAPRALARELATPASESNGDHDLDGQHQPMLDVDDYTQYLQDQDQEGESEVDAAASAGRGQAQAERAFWQVRNEPAGVDPNMLRMPSAVQPQRESSTADHLVSPIAQHAVEMQDAHMQSTTNDDQAASTSASVASPRTPAHRHVAISPRVETAPPTSGRSQRTSAKRKDYHSHPLDAVPGILFKRVRSKSQSANTPTKDIVPKSERQSTGKGKGKGRQQTKAGGKKTKAQKERQRAFNGKVAMTARPLNASDGIIRGDGLWPEKGENTVKGNMQEIACDICNGLVHWACAGFEDHTLAPEEWVCPDCQDKVKKGVSPSQIPRGPQDRCMRWSCIKREKKKIVLHPGDQDEYYVEKFIGRRAIARTEDRSKQRVFEYLVKWLGYSTDVSTWEHETNFPSIGQYLDQFLSECDDHKLDPKNRVVLFPEAARYFNAEGNSFADEDESDEEVEHLENPPLPRLAFPPKTTSSNNAASRTVQQNDKALSVERQPATAAAGVPGRANQPEEKIDDDGELVDSDDSIDGV